MTVIQRVRTNFRRTVFRLQISVWFFSSRSFSSVHIFVRSFFRLCIFSSVHFFVCAFVRLCFFSSVHIFVCAFFRLNIFSFTHFFVCEFFRPCISSSVHFFVCPYFRLCIFFRLNLVRLWIWFSQIWRHFCCYSSSKLVRTRRNPIALQSDRLFTVVSCWMLYRNTRLLPTRNSSKSDVIFARIKILAP